MPTSLSLYLSWLAAVNLITAVAYASDKRAASRGDRRVPERTLFLLNLAGGVAGAWPVFFVKGQALRLGWDWGRRKPSGAPKMPNNSGAAGGQGVNMAS